MEVRAGRVPKGGTDREANSDTECTEKRVALLTTRLPKFDSEAERIVFGVYEIKGIHEDCRGRIWIEGSAEHAIRLSESNARKLPYWEFKQGNPDWRTGLFRYMSDQEVTNFLHALNPHLRSAQDRAVLERLLACSGNLEPERGDGEHPGCGGRAQTEIRPRRRR